LPHLERRVAKTDERLERRDRTFFHGRDLSPEPE
jgi:hypothetical protein